MEIDKVFCGNSAEVLKMFPADIVDLTVTSPPYDDLRVYDEFEKDRWENTWHTIISELYRVTKPGGVVIWVVNDSTNKGSESGTSFKQTLYAMEIGFNLHDTMIYSTDKPPEGGRRYQSCFEFMFVWSKGKPKTFNPILERTLGFGDKKKRSLAFIGKDTRNGYTRNIITETKEYKPRTNIWIYHDRQNTDHPAPFPIMLALDHIVSWSNPGDTVLDCFAGSGTTLEQAVNLGRHYIGVEISQKYINEMINPRLKYAKKPLPGFYKESKNA
jgi:DNA modification methylase